MAGAQQAKSQSCTTLKKTPLVYMASQTALICKCYAAECTKTRAKILQQKTAKKRKTHPKSSEKGETGCVLGAGGDGNGCGQVRTDGKPGNRAEGLGLRSAPVSSRQSATGARSPPRHAVLEWMWESAAGSGEGLGVIRFPPQVPERAVLVWCCELFLEKDCVSTTTSSFERKAPPPGGWPSRPGSRPGRPRERPTPA